MTDLIEANSMGHEPDMIDINSASWDQLTMEEPLMGLNATMRAIVRGVNEGRRGLGNIYVGQWRWRRGWWLQYCDGYAASMWTISINSAINTGEMHYDESCFPPWLPLTVIELRILTLVWLLQTCMESVRHTWHQCCCSRGCWRFLPLALEANENLTWRDMHLTGIPCLRIDSYIGQWTVLVWSLTIWFGFWSVGCWSYGGLDFKTMAVRSCKVSLWRRISNGTSPDSTQQKSLFLTVRQTAVPTQIQRWIILEHVQAVITWTQRDVELFSYSSDPQWEQDLWYCLRRINDDDSQDGFHKMAFMTTHTWAENPRGKWTLEAEFVKETGRFHQGMVLLLMVQGMLYTNLPVTDFLIPSWRCWRRPEDRKKNVR